MQTGGRQGPEIWLRGPVSLDDGPHAGHRKRPSALPVSPPASRPTSPPPPPLLLGGHPRRHRRHHPHHRLRRPGLRPRLADPGGPPSILLVARTHAAGLAAVTRALELFRRGEAPPGLDLDAVVLVADAPGRLPRQLAQHIKSIESVIDVYRVPWVPSWRLGDLTGPHPGRQTPCPASQAQSAPLAESPPERGPGRSHAPAPANETEAGHGRYGAARAPKPRPPGCPWGRGEPRDRPPPARTHTTTPNPHGQMVARAYNAHSYNHRTPHTPGDP